MTAKSSSLALISRPMHVLAVREFIELHPEEYFIVLVSYSSDTYEQEAIRRQLQLFRTDKVKVIEKSRFLFSAVLNVYAFLAYAWVLKLRYRKLNHVLLSGGVKSRILYKHLNFKKLILIDEGSSSLWKLPFTIETRMPFRPATGFRKLYRHFRVNDLPTKPFLIFTMYDQFWDKSDLILPNKLQFWKKLLVSYPVKENEVLILGTTYGKFGLQKSEYEKLLVDNIGPFTDHIIYYKYHKKEKDKIHIPGVKTLKTKLPIEAYFINEKYFPGKIIAVNSTALRIIQLIKPDVMITNIDLKFK